MIYEVAFSSSFNDSQMQSFRSLADFVALSRAVRREKDMEPPPQGGFPLRRFRKMSPDDDPRQHTKIIALVNAFLSHCSEHAQNKPWWQVFCVSSRGGGNSDSKQRLRAQAKAWQQYFTPATEAAAVMDVARKILRNKGGMMPSVWVEPAAGAGDICGLFPGDGSRSVCIDIDPKLCLEYGWRNGDFLRLSREDILCSGAKALLPLTKDVVVVTNPPFVAYSVDTVEGRDGGLAHAFVRHSLKLGDVVVMLLPERFVRQEERDAATHGCEGRVVSQVHGEARCTRFDLGQERFKTITQRTVIVSFVRE